MTSVGLGILGFAHGHVNSYCRRWLDEPALGVRIVAGWDRDPQRLEKAVSDLGVEAEASVSALLARRDVEAVIICAETALHADLVEQAAEAGKTIVLQKPMALTMAEGDRIVAAVSAARVSFTMAWQMRVDPQNLQIKALLAEGRLGRVFMVRRRHGLPMCLQEAFASSWHVAPEWNRDLWADDAAHAFDFIYWLLGRPQSITAEIESLHDPRMPMDNGIALFRYPGGPLAEVSCSFTNLASENTTEVICEKGSIVQNYGDVPSCGVPRPEGAAGLKWFVADENRWVYSDIPTPAGHGERIADLAGPIAEFVRGERPAIATAEEGREVLRMILAGYVAQRRGARTMIDDPAVYEV